MPKPTNGGKTYTFHIKPGVKFSPPVSRQVVCNDFVNAMERLANPKDGGEYSFYYTVIKGWDAYAAGKAKSISGIKSRTTSTIVFNLTAPTGDFLKRMGMPATGPQPRRGHEVLRGPARQVRPDLISTAGYMIQGIDKVDISSCAALKPASGYDGQTHLIVVRNPNYKQSTDPTRKNYVDEVRFTDRREQHGHLQQDRGRPARHGDVEHPAVGAEEVRDDPEPEVALLPELG